jgi:hypothetical protein
MITTIPRIKIVTHGGLAHFDEMCAVSLILAHGPDTFDVELYRRNPTKEELENPETWVVDIGREYNSELKNFDHHQSKDLESSFILVAKYFNLDYLFKNVYEWWDIKSKFDTDGPFEVAKLLNIDKAVLPQLNSPMEAFLSGTFSTQPLSVVVFLKQFGKWLIENAKTIQQESLYLESCPIKAIGDYSAIIVQDRYDINTKSLVLYMKRTKHQGVVLQITKENPDRGSGWKVYRDDSVKDKIDFTRIVTDPRVAFAHLNGFIFTTKDLIPLEELFQLIQMAFLV